MLDAVSTVWSLWGIGVMTLLLSVLTENWSTSYHRALAKTKSREAKRLFDAQAAHQSQPQDRLTSSHNLGEALAQAAKDFHEHARYFMHGRKSTPPKALRSLLGLTDDAEGAARLRLAVEQEVASNASEDVKHWLFLMTYERTSYFCFVCLVVC